MVQTDDGNVNQLDITEELKRHVDEMEINRWRLLTEYRNALFATEYLKLKSLPSLNPLYLFFSIFEKIMKNKIYLVLIFGVLIIFFTIIFMSLFNLLPLIFFGIALVLLLLVGYSPLFYWFYVLYKRIQLTVFRDYLRNHIRRALELWISYYDLLCKGIEDSHKTLSNSVITPEAGLKMLKEFHESIRPPKFLRNISLSGISVILGIISIIKTITAQVGGEKSQTLINLLQVLLPKTLITPPFERGLLILIILIILSIEFLFILLVIAPITIGIKKSVRYSNDIFGEMEKEEMKKIEEMLSYLSSSRSKIFKRIP